jgi:hypothetical protein
MTSLTSKNPGWRRAATVVVAGSALVAGVLAGTATAAADPDSPVTPGGAASPTTPAASPVTPGGSGGERANDAAAGDQALAEIAATYDTGAGGGQISQLIHSVMKLRQQGFYPSKGNVIALQDGLDRRPNQQPLVQALQETLAFQRRAQMRQASQPKSPVNAGIGTGNGSGIWTGPIG